MNRRRLSKKQKRIIKAIAYEIFCKVTGAIAAVIGVWMFVFLLICGAFMCI